MAIQISGCTVIDNDRNITNANNMCVGTGITMIGSSGNISIAGTLTASGFNIPANVVSFSPANGATAIQPSTVAGIIITFNQSVGIATTGTILLKSGSTGGSTLQTLGVGNILSTTNGIIIKPVSNVPFSTSIVPIIPAGFIQSTSGSFVGLNTTGADSYSFTTADPNLGQSFEGGFLICKSSPTRWVVAPNTSEVSRSWNSRNDANTTAQQVSGCTGWFVPLLGQLQNPGFACRTYWDSYDSRHRGYWSSSSGAPHGNVWYVRFTHGFALCSSTGSTRCVRAFRCVTY